MSYYIRYIQQYLILNLTCILYLIIKIYIFRLDMYFNKNIIVLRIYNILLPQLNNYVKCLQLYYIYTDENNSTLS